MSRGFYDRDDDRYGRESESGYSSRYRSNEDYDDYGREGDFGRRNYGEFSGRGRTSDTGFGGSGGTGGRDYGSTYEQGGEFGSRSYTRRPSDFGEDRESRQYGRSGQGSYGRSRFGRGSREDRFQDEWNRPDEERFGYARSGGYGSESSRERYDPGPYARSSYRDESPGLISSPGYGAGGAESDRERWSGGSSERRYGLGREDWRSESRNREDRGWLDHVSDIVASWFGDEEASRRLRMEEQQNRQRYGRGEHRGRGPKNYRRSDARIQEDINDRLSDHPFIDATDIEVTVTNAEVVLSGTVNDRREKRLAEDLAENVSGVNNVENKLRVNRGTFGSTTGTTGVGSSTATTGAMGAAAGGTGTGATQTPGTSVPISTPEISGDTETGSGSRSRARGTTT